MQSHVTRFGELGFDRLLREPDCDFIVTVDDGRGLGISQILQHLSLSSRDFGRPEGPTIFRLLHRRAYNGYARRVHRDGRVDEARIAAAGEVVKRAGYTAGFGPRQVGGVGEDVQEHVRRSKDLAPIPVCRHKAKKPIQLGHGALRGRSLDAGQGTGCRKDPAIHAPPIIEQVPDGDL